jgi:hypothetical protein
LASAFAKGYGETGRFSSVAGLFKPTPSPKPRQNPKILAAHRYIFCVNALVLLQNWIMVTRRFGCILIVLFLKIDFGIGNE